MGQKKNLLGERGTKPYLSNESHLSERPGSDSCIPDPLKTPSGIRNFPGGRASYATSLWSKVVLAVASPLTKD